MFLYDGDLCTIFYTHYKMYVIGIYRVDLSNTY